MYDNAEPEILGPPKGEFDYKDVEGFQRYLDAHGRLYSRKRTGLDAQGQRRLKKAVKFARFLALVPYGA